MAHRLYIGYFLNLFKETSQSMIFRENKNCSILSNMCSILTNVNNTFLKSNRLCEKFVNLF